MVKGFGLIGLLITVAIIALLFWGGGGLYSSYFKQEKSVIQNDLGAIKEAQALKDAQEAKSKSTQNELEK